MKTKKYRPDIDTLRAIAILSVILYHAHIPFFQGGFIGVSIFFVISGYLITNIIKQKLENGTFSFLEFYENRIRRILPALTVMLLTVMAFYYVLTSHIELLPVQRSIKRTIVGLANFYFYYNSGYFDQAAETMPLLHTWSLGVEEQFYFIIPALLYLFYKKLKGNLYIIHLLWALLLTSLAASLISVYYNQNFTFYMLPTRAWELLLGSVLAYTAWTPQTQRGKFFCTLSGFVLIVLPVLFYDTTIAFPGFWALPPCLGACLYIAGGTDAQKSLLTYITYNKLLVFIGLISYSLYLWHWPIFVFYQTFPFYIQISTMEGIMLCLLAIFIAGISWKFIENPFRYNPIFKNRKIIWTIALIFIGGTLYLGSALRHSNVNIAYSYTPPAKITEFNPQAKSKHLDFLLIGDSHALSMTNLFSELALQNNLYGQFHSQIIKNCINPNKRNNDLSEIKNNWNKLSELYKTHSVDVVFFIYRLTEKFSGKDIYYNKFSPEYPIVYLKNKKLSPHEAMYQGLRDSILEAKKYGVQQIYIQLPLPEPKASVPQKASVLHNYYQYNTAKINKILGESVDEYQERTHTVLEILSDLKKEFPDIQFIDPAPYFLNETKTHYLVVNKKHSYYYDDDHPSIEGTYMYKNPYEKILSSLTPYHTDKL